MSWLEAVLLGVVQGLTEFLPVSSDGHLSAAEMLLPRFRQVGVLFDVMVHLGTLAAVIVYFRKTIRDDVAGLFAHDAERRNASWKLAVLVLAATVPTCSAPIRAKRITRCSGTM